MKARLTAGLVGFALGYRLGNTAAYWYLRARLRREEAEAIRGLGRALRGSIDAERSRRAA